MGMIFQRAKQFELVVYSNFYIFKKIGMNFFKVIGKLWDKFLTVLQIFSDYLQNCLSCKVIQLNLQLIGDVIHLMS